MDYERLIQINASAENPAKGKKNIRTTECPLHINMDLELFFSLARYKDLSVNVEISINSDVTPLLGAVNFHLIFLPVSSLGEYH